MQTLFRYTYPARMFPRILANMWAAFRPQGAVAPERREASDPREMARQIKAKARELGAGIVGICEMRDEYLLAGETSKYRYAISLGVPMRRDVMLKAPRIVTGWEVSRVYGQVAYLTVNLARHIRSLGWPALGLPINSSSAVLHIPVGVAAGLGELGKHGSLISKEYGSNFRLTTVLTDLPLVTDSPVDIGVEDLCLGCRVCVEECPPHAEHRRRLDAKRGHRSSSHDGGADALLPRRLAGALLPFLFFVVGVVTLALSGDRCPDDLFHRGQAGSRDPDRRRFSAGRARRAHASLGRGTMRILSRVLAFGPLVRLSPSWRCCAERIWLDAQLTEPSAVAWGDGDGRLTVQSQERRDGETSRHRLSIQRGAETLFSEEVAIDWDLWGGGFVTAMQADRDPEMEIVAYGSLLTSVSAPQRQPFFLDYEGTAVRVQPFEKASAEARDAASGSVPHHGRRRSRPLRAGDRGLLRFLWLRRLHRSPRSPEARDTAGRPSA